MAGQRDAEDHKSQTEKLQVEAYQLGMECVRSLTPMETPSEVHMKYFLWNAIEVNLQTCQEDAAMMLKGGFNVNRAPAQVLRMFKHTRVREFLTSGGSDAILVEAPMDSQDEMARCTATSLACALLLQDLSSQSHAGAIHYFCGRHNYAQDPLSNGIGIIKMLTGQLLCLQQEYDLSFLNPEWRTALESSNPQAFYRLFAFLIEQVNVPVLFIVIDSISLFEGNERRDDTVEAIREIRDIALASSHRVNIKLLLTSSRTSRNVGQLFKPGGLVKLRLDEDAPEVSLKSVRLEIARNGVGKSPSPGGGHRFSHQGQ
jgi:hypothetical protein